MNKDNLTYVDEHGLLGSNFYFHKYEAMGLTKEDITSVGLTSERVQVHADIIKPLIEIDKAVGLKGYRIYVKEGYRSKALYEIVYKKRVAKFGKEDTDRLLNMEVMPHAEGKSVDIGLWDPTQNKMVDLRNYEDGIDALFVDFYKNKEDEKSKTYQELQELLISIMQEHGFRLGTKREYFHFNYRPNHEKTY